MVELKNLPSKEKLFIEDKKSNIPAQNISMTCCYTHTKIVAKYLCEKCNQALCRDCWLQHKKVKPDHEIINCEDKGFELLDEMRQIIEQDSAGNISENILSLIHNKVRRVLKELDTKILKNIKEFCEEYKIPTELKNLKKSRKKMEKLSQNSDFVGLYKYGKTILYKTAVHKTIPYEILHKKVMKFVEDFAKKCDESIKETIDIGKTQKVINVNEKQMISNIETEEEKEKKKMKISKKK